MSNEGYCGVDCRHTYWRGYGPVRWGDVRRCEHGKVWQATGRSRENVWFHHLDVWERLGWWRPIAYRRARRLLRSVGR